MSESKKTEQWTGSGPVLLHYADHVATLTLNRPDQSNGMNLEMMRAIHAALMKCHGDPRVRVVHLRGNGANFCAGGDVQEFADKGEQLGDFLREVTAYLQMAISAMIHLNAVVICEVQGYAAGGGGLGLVCASDIVIAADSSKFLAGATRVGMAPDAGASVILPRLVGLRRATEIFMTNRVIDAKEALDIGLITSTAADEDLSGNVNESVRRVAAGAPKALSATKRLLWSGLGLGVDACMPEEARTVSELSSTADAREGLSAVIERRKPIFSGQ